MSRACPDTYEPTPPADWRASHYRTLLALVDGLRIRQGRVNTLFFSGGFEETRLASGPVSGHLLRERLWDLAAAGVLDSLSGQYPEFVAHLSPFGLWLAQEVAIAGALDDVRWDALLARAPTGLRPGAVVPNAVYLEEALPSERAWLILSVGAGQFGLSCIERDAVHAEDGRVARYPSLEAAHAALLRLTPPPETS